MLLLEYWALYLNNKIININTFVLRNFLQNYTHFCNVSDVTIWKEKNDTVESAVFKNSFPATVPCQDSVPQKAMLYMKTNYACRKNRIFPFEFFITKVASEQSLLEGALLEVRKLGNWLWQKSDCSGWMRTSPKLWVLDGQPMATTGTKVMGTQGSLMLGGGSMLPWAMFCWETLSIYVDGSGHVRKDIVPYYTAIF